MTVNNKILKLPPEQLSWLLLIKDTFKRTFSSVTKDRKEVIIAIETKAVERGYNEIGLYFNSKELDEYFKN